jgi:hypothetical protein
MISNNFARNKTNIMPTNNISTNLFNSLLVLVIEEGNIAHANTRQAGRPVQH